MARLRPRQDRFTWFSLINGVAAVWITLLWLSSYNGFGVSDFISVAFILFNAYLFLKSMWFGVFARPPAMNTQGESLTSNEEVFSTEYFHKERLVVRYMFSVSSDQLRVWALNQVEALQVDYLLSQNSRPTSERAFQVDLADVEKIVVVGKMSVLITYLTKSGSRKSKTLSPVPDPSSLVEKFAQFNWAVDTDEHSQEMKAWERRVNLKAFGFIGMFIAAVFLPFLIPAWSLVIAATAVVAALVYGIAALVTSTGSKQAIFASPS